MLYVALGSSYLQVAMEQLTWNVSFISPGSSAYKTSKSITRFAENTVILADQYCMTSGFTSSSHYPLLF